MTEYKHAPLWVKFCLLFCREMTDIKQLMDTPPYTTHVKYYKEFNVKKYLIKESYYSHFDCAIEFLEAELVTVDSSGKIIEDYPER